MGVTKQYLRYVPAGLCNVIGSQSSNLVYVDDRRCAVGACENVYVWALRTREKVITLHGEKSFVTLVRVSPDGGRVAVGYEDGTIKIFELKSPDAPKVVLQGHKNGVNCANFSRDGLVLASGGKDGVVILWDLVNECGLFRLLGHQGSVTQCRFIGSKEVLVTSSKDTFVKFWDLTSQHCFYTLADSRSEVWDFVLTKDDTQMVIGSVESELRIYDLVWLDDGDGKDESIIDAEMDGKRLRFGSTDSGDGDADQANNILRCKKFGTLFRHAKGRVTHLSLSDNGGLLICVGTGQMLDAYRIYSAAEMKTRITKKTRKARKKAAAGDSEYAKIEDIESTIESDVSTQYVRLGEYKASSKIRSVAARHGYSSPGTYKLLLLLDSNEIDETTFEIDDKSIRQAASSSGSTQDSRISSGHSTDVRAMAFSHDNSAFLSASKEAAKIWNRHSLTCIRSLPCNDAISAAFVTGDRHCIIGTKSGSLSVCDIGASEVLEEIAAHSGCVWALCLTPDQKGIVSASADKTVKFWDFELVTQDNKKLLTLAHTRTLKVDEDVLCVKISSDFKYIVLGLLDNTAKVFFVDSFKFYLSLYGHSLPVLCLDVSTDNNLIITGSADKNVKIWGMDFGDCHRSLFAHDDSVTCVQFVPKTHLFFSAGKDGKIKQWDADKFERIFILDGHHKEIWSMAISGNGNFLVSAAHDKSIRMWEKTDEIVVLEDERENEREQEHEKALEQTEDVVPGNVESEAALASKKTLDTVKAAEQIIEALDVCREESVEMSEAEKARKQPHPLMRAFGSQNLHQFIADVLRRVRSSDLEKALLIVPYGYVLELLGYLTDCMEGNYEMELVTRCSFFLLRVHHGHIVNSTSATPVIDRLRTASKTSINQARDTVGFNLSALKFMQLELAEKEQVQLFVEAKERLTEKKQKRRKKHGNAQSTDKAYVLSVKVRPRRDVTRTATMLFLWSIVSDAVGYVKRHRLSQWMKRAIVDSYSDGKRLILRRNTASTTTPRNPRRGEGESSTRQWPDDNHRRRRVSNEDVVESNRPASTSLLLWRTENSEIVLDGNLVPLEASLWRIFDDLTVSASHIRQCHRTDLAFFTAVTKPRDGEDRTKATSSEGESKCFNIEDVCQPLAWRSDGDRLTVLFGCSIDQLADIACAWICGRAIFRDTFETEVIATELLSSEFAHQLGLLDLAASESLCSSKSNVQCNGDLVNGIPIGGPSSPRATVVTASLSLSTSGCYSGSVETTITTTANGGANLVGGEGGGAGDGDGRSGGQSRASVLCSLEQLCLSDILAAKDLCRSLGTFDDDLSPADNGGEASVYHTCNRDFIDTEPVRIINKTYFAAPPSSSLGSSRDTSGLDERDMTESKPGTSSTTSAALSPLSVDIFGGGVTDFLSVSTDHLSPCHGFNDRLLDRRWYSTWRCDSSADSSDGIIMRQPTASLPSRSSSRKRRSVRTSEASRAKSRSDSLQIPTNRRWSLPSPPQERSRSFSLGKLSRFRQTPNVKPPNILIYTGDDDSTTDVYARLERTIARSVQADQYCIYRLKRARFLNDPWPNNSVCIVLADTSGLDDRCWQRLFEYFKCGGKMFFVCENRLLASLNDSSSEKRRYGLLKLAFDTNQPSRNQKDFKEFLKRLSKSLKKPSVCEHFNVLNSDGRPRFTLSFVREASTPLILYMQNSQDRAVALFSDVTLDAVVTAGRSLINEVLQRLGLDLADGDSPPALTCGYLISDSQDTHDSLVDEFLSIGRIDDGLTSIEFFNNRTVPADRVTATRVYLPVWINAEDRAIGFDAKDYFEHLDTTRIGRCVLYVPVATSTMTYFEGLLAKLPDKFSIVAIAKTQLEGQGRGGNRFLSPDGCASFTIGLRLPTSSRLAQSPGFVQHLLALAAVDSICSSREELSTFHLRLKWPNDIFYGIGRLIKIGGVLVNCLARNDTLFFIAGLGLNIENSSPTTCVNDMLPPEIASFSIEQIVALTLSRFEKLVDLFEQRGHEAVLPLYYKYWLHNHQELTLAQNQERVIVRGLDKKGYLEVRSRQTGRVFSLQPDGNTFDMMHNLVKIND